MKEIKAFVTSDEKMFSTEKDARDHEEHMRIYPVIDTFLDSEDNMYRGVPQRAIVRRAIATWELWKNNNV